MGNVGSSTGNGRRRHGSRRSSRRSEQPPPPSQNPQPEITANRAVFRGAAPYPGHYPNPNPDPPHGYLHYLNRYPPAPTGYRSPHPPALPMTMPSAYDYQHHVPHMDPAHAYWAAGRYSHGPSPAPVPYLEHQKAITTRNDVNLKKESLRVERDEENPGKFLVAFNFDATTAGSITIIFFAKEGEDSQLKALKRSLLPPVTVHFEAGLGQKFKQPTGTGIDFSKFKESQLLEKEDSDVYPLAVKAESHPQETDSDDTGSSNSLITQAVFEREKGEYNVKVVKRILWVNGTRYELQEIYGIGNLVEGKTDANDPGRECVICLSEPRDTTVLPCRHMCMCSGCAKVLRFQTNRCPICGQPVEGLLVIKVAFGDQSRQRRPRKDEGKAGPPRDVNIARFYAVKFFCMVTLRRFFHVAL